MDKLSGGLVLGELETKARTEAKPPVAIGDRANL
jgi:hypothetical protein